MLSVNLLSSLKRTRHHWQTYQFWCTLANANQAACGRAVSKDPTRACQALVLRLVRNKRTRRLLDGDHFKGLCQYFSSWAKEQIPILLLCCCLSTALSSSACIMACLLLSPPCIWNCAGWCTKLPLRQHVRICHLGGAGLPLQPYLVTGTSSCYK